MKELSDCRILLVDDAKTNIDILVEALKGDYKLSVALSGEAALQVADRSPPDLILLDIVMPGLDGYEVCRRLRAQPSTHDLPIIFLSSLDDVKNKTAGFEAGGTDYVTKPFDILEVKARVRSLLKAKAYTDAVAEQRARELQIARDIQRGILPSDFKTLVGELPVDLAAELHPAREVGGDLYTVLRLPEDRLCVFIGDVSGKGIPAALFMAISSTLIRSTAKLPLTPIEILGRINNELAADNPSNMFVTLLCLLIDCKTGLMQIANGGHCFPVHIRRGTTPRFLDEGGGTLIGIMEDVPITPTELQLEPGDLIFTYTDGVNEAMNPARELFEYDRILQQLEGATERSAADSIQRMLTAVRAFANGAEQSDDIAMLAFRYQPAATASAVAEIELKSTPQEVMRGCESIRAHCEKHGVPEKAIHDLMLAFEETGSNVVNHACAGKSDDRFWLRIECRPEVVELMIRDRGPAFDPLAAPEVDLTGDPDERGIGGLGIHLVRNVTDALAYERIGDENRLTITRRLDRPEPPET